MLCHKMSFTMKNRNCKNCGRRRHHHHHQYHHQFCNVFVLSIMWTILFTETMARPNLTELLSNKPTNDVLQQQQEQQQQQHDQQPYLFLDEIMTNTNGEKLFNKLQKYHHQQPHYLSKWPGLRDLVLSVDYDDTNSLEESSEFLNTKFFERLRQLASAKTESYEDGIHYDSDKYTNIMPEKSYKSSASSSLSSNQLSFKDHNIKKNVQFHKQYMSPCHFKICNMGRKRDARFFKDE